MSTTTSNLSPMSTLSMSTLSEFLVAQLGRELDAPERALLLRLSPHGIAKINRDALNGIPIDQTLSDLKAIFARSQERRHVLETDLCGNDSAVVLVQKLGRPATTDELALLTNVPFTWISQQVTRRQNEGETLGLILEDLALQYKFEQLTTDAREYSRTQDQAVVVLHLSPTVRPTAVNPLAPNMIRVDRQRTSVGLSPVQQWFYDASHESEKEPIVSTGSPTRNSNGSKKNVRFAEPRLTSSDDDDASGFRTTSTSVVGRITTPPTPIPVGSSLSAIRAVSASSSTVVSPKTSPRITVDNSNANGFLKLPTLDRLATSSSNDSLADPALASASPGNSTSSSINSQHVPRPPASKSEEAGMAGSPGKTSSPQRRRFQFARAFFSRLLK